MRACVCTSGFVGVRKNVEKREEFGKTRKKKKKKKKKKEEEEKIF